VDSDKAARLVVYNSHGRWWQELVTFKVSKHDVLLYMMVVLEEDEEEEAVPLQVSPVFTPEGEILNTEYQVTFLAYVPALGLQTYYIRQLKAEDGESEELGVASVKLLHTSKEPFQELRQSVQELYTSVAVSESSASVHQAGHKLQ